MTDLPRRQFTQALALSVFATHELGATETAAASNNAESAVFVPPLRLEKHFSELFGNTPIAQGVIDLSLPALAENGNSVALGLTIDSRTTESPVDRVYVFAENNPLPDVARFQLNPQQTLAEIALRIRLADSQQIIAVAQTQTGALYAGSASIVVTLAACIDIPR